MNIYIKELKSNRKSIIIWSVAMILFVIMGMQKYTSIVGVEGSEAFLGLIDKMPNFLKVMWGVDKLNITTATGYFGVLFSYLLLMASIHSSMLGTTIIYKEERDKTAEFLMSKPVSRNTILTSKILAVITNIIIFNIVTFITSIFVLKSLTNDPISKEIILCMISTFIIQLLFMTIGVGLASILKDPKRSSVISMAILIITFFLSITVDLSDKLKLFKVLTPFKYFEAKNFFISNTLNIWYILLSIFIMFIILMFSYKEYTRRDLKL